MQPDKYTLKEQKTLVIMAVLFVVLGVSALVRDGEMTRACWVFAVAANLAGFLALPGRRRGEKSVCQRGSNLTMGLFFLLALALLVRTSSFEGMVADDIAQGRIKLVRGALLLGTDRNAATGPMRRPLLGIAVDRKQRKVVQILLEWGADPNRADVQGWTPLSIARYRGDEEMAALLTRYGATEHSLPVLPRKK